MKKQRAREVREKLNGVGRQLPSDDYNVVKNIKGMK